MAQAHGIPIKKQFGQHFLRDQKVVIHMLDQVTLTKSSSIFEIGCGDGFLTQEIVKHPCARFWIFEIDPQWAGFIKNAVPDPRITVFEENILDVDFRCFTEFEPWTLLANLPYQITFPLLYRFVQYKTIFKEGVIMVQEEVAQKIVKRSGRGYGFSSLFLQYHFEWKLLQKVLPGAFVPPPKVTSRLLYFKPKLVVQEIPHADAFWKFIKLCFAQPRRTLKNNLAQSHYATVGLSPELLALRAQQMSMDDFLQVWNSMDIKG